MKKRERRNPTAYYDRYLPSDYARRLVSSHGLKRAEEMTARGSEKYGKTHAGWWPASYDTTQTIKHSGVYVKKNPKALGKHPDLTEKLKRERRIKNLTELIRKLRIGWYGHEDSGVLNKNKNLQYNAYNSLKTLFESMPGYKTSRLIEIKKWLSAHRDWKIKSNPKLKRYARKSRCRGRKGSRCPVSTRKLSRRYVGIGRAWKYSRRTAANKGKKSRR